jgi:hypothetical protein
MRYVNSFALLAVLVLTVLTTRLTPFYVETILRTEDNRGQRQTLRKMCRDTLARHRAIYQERPAEEWPSERAKLIHANAQRILAELEETKP